MASSAASNGSLPEVSNEPSGDRYSIELASEAGSHGLCRRSDQASRRLVGNGRIERRMNQRLDRWIGGREPHDIPLPG